MINEENNDLSYVWVLLISRMTDKGYLAPCLSASHGFKTYDKAVRFAHIEYDIPEDAVFVDKNGQFQWANLSGKTLTVVAIEKMVVL